MSISNYKQAYKITARYAIENKPSRWVKEGSKPNGTAERRAYAIFYSCKIEGCSLNSLSNRIYSFASSFPKTFRSSL